MSTEFTNPEINRASWGSGPWDGEPDKAQWIDAETDLDCLAVRHPSHGHWCGYVGVPPGHPLHGTEYETPAVDVHGALTFASACNEGDKFGVCHVPESGRPAHVWWFGFDCAHLGDKSPAYDRHSGIDIYRTLRYIKDECANLARQLKTA